MAGRLIAFEGIDGCGKSTQARMLCDFIKSMGLECVFVREPGGTDLGERIRDILLGVDMDPITELFLFLSARSRLYSEVVIPSLNSGKFVVSDRSPDSSVAYQGYGRGIDRDFIENANAVATRGIKPDIVFYIDITVREALERKEFKDRMEKTSLLERVRKGYLEMVEMKGFVILDGSKSVDEIHENVKRVFLERIRRDEV